MKVTDIEKKYDDMIKKADELGKVIGGEEQKDSTLTDEQVDKITKVLSETPISNDTKLYNDAVNTDHGDMQTKAVTEVPLVNPRNGMHVVGSESSVKYDEDINIDDIMSLDGDVDITDTPITSEHVENIMHDVYPDFNMSLKDTNILIDLATRYNKGAVFKYYNSMPDYIKGQIDNVVGKAGIGVSANNAELKGTKNSIAEQLLSMIAEHAVNDAAIIDLNTSTQNIRKDMNDDAIKTMSTFFALQKEQYEINYPAQAEEIYASLEAGDIAEADVEKMKQTADNYANAAKSFVEAYTYEKMMDKFRTGKLKVKPIQLEKFKRTCEDFDYKYQKSNMNINSVKLLGPTLARRLTNQDITAVDINRFICVFVNYTKNMSPSNIGEHVFMYYFIKNILNLDIYEQSDEEQVKFYTELVSNIEKCILEIKNYK